MKLLHGTFTPVFCTDNKSTTCSPTAGAAGVTAWKMAIQHMK